MNFNFSRQRYEFTEAISWKHNEVIHKDDDYTQVAIYLSPASGDLTEPPMDSVWYLAGYIVIRHRENNKNDYECHINQHDYDQNLYVVARMRCSGDIGKAREWIRQNTQQN